MNKTIAAVVAIVVVAGLGAAWYVSTQSSPVAYTPAVTPVVTPTVSTTSGDSTPNNSEPPVQSSTTAAPTLPQVMLDGQVIDVDLAQTPAEQAQGLGGRTSLGSHDGMLFIFQKDGYEAFWMKDMSFAIDMIWLSDDGTVVYIQPDVSPDTYPEAFVPSQPARYVLELPANFAKTYGVKVGDKAVLP